MVLLSGRRGAVARPPLRFGIVISFRRKIMKCDICSQDVENSEELQKHKERAHPTGVSDKSIDNLEKPDLLEDTPEESPAIENPVPIH
jgi:hypothetical protein